MTNEAKKMTETYRVNFTYAAPDGGVRTASRIAKAQTPIEARSLTARSLSEKYDWFKIGNVVVMDNDNIQKNL